MQILIKQDKIPFFGRRYVVIKERRKLYEIRKAWPNPIPAYKISEFQSGKVIGNMQNKFLSLRAHAALLLPSGEYTFEQASIGAMSFECVRTSPAPQSTYKLQGAKGLTGAIYQDGEQVGQWDKNRFVVLDGDNYVVDLDFDADIPLMALMMVLVDNYRISVSIGGDIGWEVGNMGKGLQESKSDWKPKEKGS